MRPAGEPRPSPAAYRVSPAVTAECPLCLARLDNVVSATCPSCGLWWVSRDLETVSAPSSSGAPAPSPFLLGEGGHVAGISVGLLLGAALLATSAAPLSPRWQMPDPGLTWAMRVVAVLIVGGFGLHFLLASLAALLPVLSPSRLEIDGPHLRVRVWNNWSSLRAAFRRTDTRVPRGDVRWVGLGAGQAGQALLFVVHASGRAFGTGWSGSPEEGKLLAARLAAWLQAGDGTCK